MTAYRIAHVIDSLDVTGGAERQLIANLRAFDHGAHAHEIVLLRQSADSRIDEVPPEVPVKSLFGPEGPPSRVAVARALRRLARDRKYDLVHGSLPDASLAVRYVGLTSSITAVESLVNISHEPVRTLDNPAVSASKLRFHRELDRWTMKGLDRLHAVSSTVADSWSRVVGLRRETIDVIPRGIDVSGIQPAETVSPEDKALLRADLGIGTDAFLILTVGRVEPQKGHRYLIEAVSLLRAEFPEIRLVIIGRPGNSSADVARRIADEALGEQVLLHGPRRDVTRVLATADLFAFPSLFEGNGGNAMIEAMAVGLPIITSNSPPMTDLIHHESNGLLFKRADSTELARAIRRLIGDPELRVGLGAQARASALELPTPAETASRFEEWYRFLLTRAS